MAELFIVHLRMHWEGNDSFREPIGGFQVIRPAAKSFEHFLAVRGYRIVDHGRNRVIRQEFIQSVAVNPFQ